MARVRLVNLTKRYGHTVAVDSVPLDINDNEFFVLLGPSGSGKSTILKLIAGLEKPDEGEIYIDGRLVNLVDPKDRDVAMVFQSYALYAHMSVFNNIAFPLRMRRKKLKLTNDDIRKKVTEMAKLLGIDHLLDRRPTQLSGGEQQRVALARALIRNPKVWLLDEPLSNLDAKLRTEMRATLKRLQRELGITTVYVTHDQVEAMTMADRLAVLDKGRVMAVSVPRELFSNPSNVFVAGFIGSPAMNILPCEIRRIDSGYKLVFEGVDIDVGEAIVSKIVKGGYGPKILLGIRPDYITLQTERTPLSYPAEVAVSELLGSEAIVSLRVGNSIIKAKVDSTKPYDIGEKVYFSIPTDKTKFYDPESQQYIQL